MPVAMRAARTRHPFRGPGTVYLLHFAERYQHAGHYVGYTENLPARLEEHRAGAGSRLLAAVSAAGIPFEVAWTWPNTSRAFERKIHCRKNTPAMCPRCTKSDARARAYTPRGIAPQHAASVGASR